MFGTKYVYYTQGKKGKVKKRKEEKEKRKKERKKRKKGKEEKEKEKKVCISQKTPSIQTSFEIQQHFIHNDEKKFNIDSDFLLVVRADDLFLIASSKTFQMH